MSINDQKFPVTEIMKSLGRLEAMAVTTRDEIVELKTETSKRLNAHAKSIRSLNKTRDRQWGAAKGLGVVGTIVGVIVGWFKYG